MFADVTLRAPQVADAMAEMAGQPSETPAQRAKRLAVADAARVSDARQAAADEYYSQYTFQPAINARSRRLAKVRCRLMHMHSLHAPQLCTYDHLQAHTPLGSRLQAANVDELHANEKAVAARELARRAAEAELRASCTFRPSLAKVSLLEAATRSRLTSACRPQDERAVAVSACCANLTRHTSILSAALVCRRKCQGWARLQTLRRGCCGQTAL